MSMQKSKPLLTLGQFTEVMRQYGQTINHLYCHDAVKRMYTGYLCGHMTTVAERAFACCATMVARFEMQRSYLITTNAKYDKKSAQHTKTGVAA